MKMDLDTKKESRKNNIRGTAVHTSDDQYLDGRIEVQWETESGKDPALPGK